MLFKHIKTARLTRFRVAILLLPLLSLNGCATAIVAGATAGAASTTKVVYDRRDFGTLGRDQKIRWQAFKALHNDATLTRNGRVFAISYNQNLLLLGQMPTAELRHRALQQVQGIPNVKNFYNEITVGETRDGYRAAKDAWITTKAKSAILKEKGVNPARFKIFTENGVVYLIGIATQDEADKAAEVARQIKRVEKVVKLVEYTQNNPDLA